MSASQYQKAYTTYSQKVGKTERVDELLNLGLLAFEAGDYQKSFSALSEAERLAEERLTKSLSREAAALALSDKVGAYQGTVFDKAMLHYYRGLGFLAQKNLESATVEGRAIAHYLEVNSRESKRTYKDDGFLQWFSGSLYDAFGQYNDAWISYKRAREIYADYYGVGEPSFLCPVTYSAVKKVGVAESEQELLKECPAADSLPSGWGRVIVLCEAGIAPPIREENIMLPIYKNDPHDFSDDERERFAHEVAMRRGHDYHHDSDVELDYLLRVALPYYANDYYGTQVTRVAVKDATDREIPADLTQNIAAILRQDLADRQPVIIVRAITRALIKYGAAKAAEAAGDKKDETLGSIFGAIVNAAGALTEAADVRSWETLPDRIYAADFRLPPGTHDLRAVFQDDLGGVVFRHDFPPVEVKPGEVVFLRARCIR